MSVAFKAVTWNRAKYVYDGVLLLCVIFFIGLHILRGAFASAPQNRLDWDDLIINAFGSCAFAMLTAVLSIGPLARLDRRFLPLLYNRRHFGVMTFFIALVHAAFVVDWFGAQGKLWDLTLELTNNPLYGSFVGFPMKALGFAALLILLLLAATSHDYWLKVLSPSAWKWLHMLIYLAYGLVTMHVALGVMQDDRNPLIPVLVGGAFVCVASLHLIVGWREWPGDRGLRGDKTEWLSIGSPLSIPDKSARVVAAPGGERIAVFHDFTKIGALCQSLCAPERAAW